MFNTYSSPLGGDTRRPTQVHTAPKMDERGHHGSRSLRSSIKSSCYWCGNNSLNYYSSAPRSLLPPTSQALPSFYGEA